jgi:hypothetical protein
LRALIQGARVFAGRASRPPVCQVFFILPASRDGRGAVSCLVRLVYVAPSSAPFGGFCPATSISLRRRPLPGIFNAGPVFLNRRTPAHPRQPDLTTMPRHTGAPGALSGPARSLGRPKPENLAPTSPGETIFRGPRRTGPAIARTPQRRSHLAGHAHPVYPMAGRGECKCGRRGRGNAGGGGVEFVGGIGVEVGRVSPRRWGGGAGGCGLGCCAGLWAGPSESILFPRPCGGDLATEKARM